jgi:hypothetical protein
VLFLGTWFAKILILWQTYSEIPVAIGLLTIRYALPLKIFVKKRTQMSSFLKLNLKV